MGITDKKEFGLGGWFTPMRGYTLKGEVGMVLARVTLRLYLIKWRYVGHLQWDITRKYPTSWANFYGAGMLVIGDTMFVRYGGKFTDKWLPTRGMWFGKFIIGSKLRVGLIKKQYFGGTSKV